MVVLFLVFWGSSILFSIMVAPIYIPSNSVRGFPFLQTLSSMLSVDLLMIAILTSVRWVLHSFDYYSCEGHSKIGKCVSSIFFKIILALWSPLRLYMNLGFLKKFYLKNARDLGRVCTEYLRSISILIILKSSSQWTWKWEGLSIYLCYL